jgi:hypothetical protein
MFVTQSAGKVLGVAQIYMLLCCSRLVAIALLLLPVALVLVALAP